MSPKKVIALALFLATLCAAILLLTSQEPNQRRPAAVGGGPAGASTPKSSSVRRTAAVKHLAALTVILFALTLTGSVVSESVQTEEPSDEQPPPEAMEVRAVLERIGTPIETLGNWTEFQSGDLAGIPASTELALAPATNYYLDAAAGSDANPGTDPSLAWKTVDRASGAVLNPGDRLFLKRGQTFTGSLKIAESGLPNASIVIGSFGPGPRPVITGGASCVKVSGSYVVVQDLELRGCSWAGVEFSGGARFNTVAGSVMANNIAGVHVASGATNNRVLGNSIRDNTKMSRLTIEPNDDSGAFGVLLNGDLNEIAYNTISGHDTFSYDYGRDGAAVEVYGGQSNHIHHNLAVNNDAFSELGNARSSTNFYGYNVVRSSLAESTFLVTRGARDGYGPVYGTSLYNNTVALSGIRSQGFVCFGGCTGEVLSLRNNIIDAGWKAGYADGPVDEDYDLFYRDNTQFTIGAHSVITNPGFIDGLNGNFDLLAGSQAIDAGAYSPYVSDFQGERVPLDGNGDSLPAPDIGAFEFSPGGVTPAPIVSPSPTRTATATPKPATPTPTPSRTPTAAPTPPSPSTTPAATRTPNPTSTPTPTPVPSTPPAGSGSVTASAETVPVPNSGDAADDPAIWVNASNPAQSAVIGTNKLGGLAVYDLSGRQLHYYAGIKPNNVDIRYGFNLGGAQVDVVTASERDSDTILVYRIDPGTRALVNLRAQSRYTGFGVSGLCMYKSPLSGKFYVFVSDSSGTVKQFELFVSGSAIDYTLVRTLSFGSMTEGCVADDYRQALYVSHEDVALWRLSAEPNGGSAKTQVAAVGGPVLTADIEGLAIYDAGNGSGYLIASSQGSDDFALFDRRTGVYRGRFKIVSAGVDGVTHTDGIDVSSAGLGLGYPSGLFVAQDNRNDTGNQNFKLVPWSAIVQALRL